MADTAGQLRNHNRQRTATAAPVLAAAARTALAAGDGRLNAAVRYALELRAADEETSWAGLAIIAGDEWTKDRLVAAYRRGIQEAGVPAPFQPQPASKRPSAGRTRQREQQQAKHAAIVAGARSSDLTLTVLARQFHASPRTVRRLLEEAGVQVPWGVRKRVVVQRQLAAALRRLERRRTHELVLSLAAEPGMYLRLIAEQTGLSEGKIHEIVDHAGIRLADGRHTPRGLKPCGTMAACARHRNHHEPACPACTRAMSEYRAERKAARKRRDGGTGIPGHGPQSQPGEPAWQADEVEPDGPVAPQRDRTDPSRSAAGMCSAGTATRTASAPQRGPKAAAGSIPADSEATPPMMVSPARSPQATGCGLGPAAEDLDHDRHGGGKAKHDAGRHQRAPHEGLARSEQHSQSALAEADHDKADDNAGDA